MTNIHETALQIQTAMYPAGEASPLALAQQAHEGVLAAAGLIRVATDGATSAEAQRLVGRYDWAAEYLRQAVAELMEADHDREQLFTRWGVDIGGAAPAVTTVIRDPAHTAGQRPGTASGGTPAQTEQAVSASGSTSEQNLFEPHMQRRLDTPIEDVLELGEADRDASSKRSLLSRLQRTGIRTLRDALVTQGMALRIYDFPMDPDVFMRRVQDAVPEVDVFQKGETMSDGERVARFCTSLDQVPLQYLCSVRRTPEMFDIPITVQDIIDADTGEPVPRTAKVFERTSLPVWYNPDRVRQFVDDFRRARRELYDES